MAFERIEFSFNDGQDCPFCGKTLSSFTGVLMREVDTGRQVWAGKDCAIKKSINPDQTIPNLVKGSFLLDPNSLSPSEKGKNSKKSNPESPTDEEALNYLVLRQEKLKHVPDVPYTRFDELYSRYKIFSLTDKDIQYLKNSMLFMLKTKKELSYQRLRNIYICDASIKQCLAKTAEDEYLKGFHAYLIKHKLLSSSQITVLNSKLTKLGFKHKISPTAFN